MVLTQQDIGQVRALVGARLEGRRFEGRTPQQVSQTLSEDAQKLFVEVSDFTNAAQNAFAFGSVAEAGDFPIGTAIGGGILTAGGGIITEAGRIDGAVQSFPEPPRTTQTLGVQDFGQPSVVSLPTTQERFTGFFSTRGLLTPTEGIPRLAEDVIRAVTAPEFVTREQRVESIDIPSILGGTQITRPVSFEDIDTGKLPPKQNLELKTQKIISDFNQGVTTEQEATNQLERAERKFVLDETRRTTAVSVAEGAAIGAISTILPPVGAVIGGAFVTSAVSRRREILEFARTNPQAAATQFVSFALGGVAGARSILGLKATKIETPKIKLVGKGRDKFIEEITRGIEPDFKILENNQRITGTRTYTIEIPTPKGKTILKILEFEKDGVRRFAGREVTKGKVEALLTGVTLESGENGLSRLITKVVTERNRGRLTDLEIQTFVEKAVVKSSKVKGLRRETLTENEAKLVKQFDLKGLNAEQVRALLRKPLFSEAEIIRRKDMAFTDAEFNAAKQLTKSEIVLGERVTTIRLSVTDSLSGGVSSTKGILDLRILEQGSGFIKELEPVKLKPKSIKVKITKEGDIIPVGKLPSPSKVVLTGEPTPPIKVKKIDTRKTPLKLTFAELETTPLLELKTKPLSSSTFLSIAKQIQKRKVKEIKSRRIKVDSLQATLRGIPRMVGGEGLTESQLSQFGGGISEVQFSEGLLAPPSVASLNINQLDFSIKTNTRLIQRIDTVLKDLSINRENIVVQQRIVSLSKIKTLTKNQLKEFLLQKQKLTQRATGVEIKPPVIKVPVLVIPKGVTKTLLVKTLIKIKKKQGVDVVVGMGKKQKIVAKNLPPFKALKTGRDFVDKNIAASFSLRKSGKKTKKKDIKPFNVGNKFRPSKRNPLFIVEKKQFRLDSKSEVKQIKSARRNKKRKKKSG